MRRRSFSLSDLRVGLLAVSLAACLLAAPGVILAQSGPVPAKSPEVGPRWTELTAAQRSALKPLERDWATIEGDRKQKWLDIAGRMPSMPPAERDRVQARMTEWARLSPQQRGQARMAYQEAKEVAPQDRQARWEAYQALSAEQKRQLQAKAARPVPPAAPKPAVQPPPRSNDRSDRPQAKSNIVPNPAYAAPPKAVAPTVIQAQPGATTNLMSKRPNPPPHQQTGLPKIAATPGFVDKTTLLPQRGPQGAATRSASNPNADKRQQ